MIKVRSVDTIYVAGRGTIYVVGNIHTTPELLKHVTRGTNNGN